MKWGFILVENTPYDDPDKTRQLLERIAFIRHTHYGGFYDFVPDLAMADTAYTNVALPAHTDTTYFTDPAGLQSFHLLSHQPTPGAGSGETASGGKSLLVDGFFAAHILAKRHPEYYHILSKVPIRWHASGNPGITITPEILFPVLEHRPNRTRPRGLFRIRWNNADRGVVPFINHKYSPAQWYEAARAWNDILKSEDVECWIQLEPGKVLSKYSSNIVHTVLSANGGLVFDNWRVLHGRSAFSGVRRICGGYSESSQVLD
jgi:alpha-ketoglutarate-dependent taurine dioxygenase